MDFQDHSGRTHTGYTELEQQRDRTNSLIISHFNTRLNYAWELLAKRDWQLLLKPLSLLDLQNKAFDTSQIWKEQDPITDKPSQSRDITNSFLASQIKAEILQIVSCQLISLLIWPIRNKIQGNLRKSWFFWKRAPNYSETLWFIGF
jgi:hypothetical protein